MCKRNATYQRFVPRVVRLYERGERLLGAEDGAAEVGFGDGVLGLEADAEGGVGAWDAEADQVRDVRRGVVQEEVSEGGDFAVDGVLVVTQWEKGRGKLGWGGGLTFRRRGRREMGLRLRVRRGGKRDRWLLRGLRGCWGGIEKGGGGGGGGKGRWVVVTCLIELCLSSRVAWHPERAKEI